ncbi:MAG: hypothetical protein V4561_12530 [Bacteroidota bacterium]
MKTLLNNESVAFYDFIIKLRESKIDWKYSIMPGNLFEQKFEDDIAGGAKQLWLETLYRVHCNVLVSYFKTIRWIDGVNSAIESGVYYSFVSNLRGLIESCSDSFYSMRSVPLTIGRDFEVILRTINGTSENIYITHQNLENSLIHFSHASKLDKEQKKLLPDYMNAKQVREYLTSISDPQDEIDTLYSYLCQIVHPASLSNNIILFFQTNDMYVNGHSKEVERKLIENLINEFSEVINRTFKIVFANGLTCLHLLNKFEVNEVQTDLQEINFGTSEAWDEVQDYINKSKAIYERAIITRVYE